MAPWSEMCFCPSDTVRLATIARFGQPVCQGNCRRLAAGCNVHVLGGF